MPCSEPSGAKKPGRAFERTKRPCRCSTATSPKTLLWHVPFGRILRRCISASGVLPQPSAGPGSVVIHPTHGPPERSRSGDPNRLGLVNAERLAWAHAYAYALLTHLWPTLNRASLSRRSADGSTAFRRSDREEGSDMMGCPPACYAKENRRFCEYWEHAAARKFRCAFLMFCMVFSWWQPRQEATGTPAPALQSEAIASTRSRKLECFVYHGHIVAFSLNASTSWFCWACDIQLLSVSTMKFVFLFMLVDFHFWKEDELC
jgi:hypothetical protein